MFSQISVHRHVSGPCPFPGGWVTQILGPFCGVYVHGAGLSRVWLPSPPDMGPGGGYVQGRGDPPWTCYTMVSGWHASYWNRFLF